MSAQVDVLVGHDVGPVMVDACVELLCCVAYVLFLTLLACN